MVDFNQVLVRFFLMVGVLSGSSFGFQLNASAHGAFPNIERKTNLSDLQLAETTKISSNQFNQDLGIHDYLLGAGDQVSIEVVGYPEFS
ncbi:MAG: hypothetical protein F6K11_31570, partial [Leptolyngbya sp. SIO3F4]|nr:hypothetical protein [Leptolyngbya sp. SIO3F4]